MFWKRWRDRVELGLEGEEADRVLEEIYAEEDDDGHNSIVKQHRAALAKLGADKDSQWVANLRRKLETDRFVEKLDQLLRDIRAKTYDGTDSFIKKHRAALAKFRANDIEKQKEKFAAEVPCLYAKHLVKERQENSWAEEYEATDRHIIEWRAELDQMRNDTLHASRERYHAALFLKRCSGPAKKALGQVKQKVYYGGCVVVKQHRAQLDDRCARMS